MVLTVDIDAAIGEQIAYYRARAGEYNDWSERRAEYDISTESRHRREPFPFKLAGRQSSQLLIEVNGHV